MARQGINIGSTANDGTGDPLRTAFDKCNDNFIELYSAVNPTSSNLQFTGNSLISEDTNGGITIDPNGTGTIELASSANVTGTLTVVNGINMNGSLTVDNIVTESNQNLSITPGGTGSILADGITIKDNTISASNSNDNLVLSASGTGNIVVGALTVNGTTLSAADSTKITIAETLDVTGAVSLLSTLAVTGSSTLDGVTINDNTISSAESNANLELKASGTGGVIVADSSGKLGFYGVTPVAQASAIAFDPAGNDGSTVEDLRTVINSMLTALRNVGIIAS
jgi:hypothetical protein